MQSRDILMRLALEYDLPTLLNFCRTSKRVNEIVCNNKFFWMNKLNKDFDIDKDDIEKFKILKNLNPLKTSNVINENIEKEYYQEITESINKYGDDLYTEAIIIGRLDLVKVALRKGADINKKSGNFTPLNLALFHNQHEIIDYLLNRGVLTPRDNFLINTENLLSLIPILNSAQQEKFFHFLYNKVLPYIYFNRKFKGFLRMAYQKLEEYRDRYPLLYETHSEKLKSLIKE